MTADDLIELARICLKHADAAKTPKLAVVLRRMAREYQRRAAQLRSGNRPSRRSRRSVRGMRKTHGEQDEVRLQPS
jgi:hypothetical protein